MQHPYITAALLTGVAAAAQKTSRVGSFSRLFSWLPVPFWCYTLPMLLSAVGLLPRGSPLYGILSLHLLPLCLALMLLDTDFASLWRLGARAVAVMLIGSIGVVSGMGISILLWKKWLPADAWMSLGALAGSWTGGSLNMLAVKEALQMPDVLLAPIIIVDTVVAYGWMAFLLTGAGAAKIDAQANDPHASKTSSRPTSDLWIVLACAAGITWIANGFFSNSVWRILFATTAALALSLTPISKISRRCNAARLGQILLLVLLTSMGARVDLKAFGQAPVFLGAGLTTLAWHALLLWMAGRLLQIPRGVLATASQANIGGVVSAPIVGAAYEKSLIAVGLLMAILGNVLGTYAGLMTATLCRRLQG
ncbi:MAG: DUF819 family protein [Candidatus Omnitrophica bacterium]|nr:DUF819 family protein [Candidatus Omnitrophota bacterium]